MLEKKQTRYLDMFKETKVSHITLQNALRELTSRYFIRRIDIGYEITEKGKKLLSKLEELKEILR